MLHVFWVVLRASMLGFRHYGVTSRAIAEMIPFRKLGN